MHQKDLDIKGVFFDLDGVILDSMSAHAQSWQLAFDELGIHIETEVFLKYEGNLNGETLELIPQVDGRLTADDFPGILKRQRKIYLDDFASSVCLYPQAAGILDHLRQSGLKLALVTSSGEKILIPEVKQLITQYFDCAVTRDQVTRSKPHPEPYLKALQATRIEPASALVVENAPAGIQAAKSAGITCLALTTTLPRESLALADMVLADHDELARWFQGI